MSMMSSDEFYCIRSLPSTDRHCSLPPSFLGYPLSNCTCALFPLYFCCLLKEWDYDRAGWTFGLNPVVNIYGSVCPFSPFSFPRSLYIILHAHWPTLSFLFLCEFDEANNCLSECLNSTCLLPSLSFHAMLNIYWRWTYWRTWYHHHQIPWWFSFWCIYNLDRFLLGLQFETVMVWWDINWRLSIDLNLKWA